MSGTCICGHPTHPQLGVWCKDCWWAQNPIEAEDGDYIKVDGDIYLMPEGVMLTDNPDVGVKLGNKGFFKGPLVGMGF